MAIIKSIPSRRIINGEVINTSEISIISERDYSTNGESCIIVKGPHETEVFLNSKTTDHVVIKSLTNVIIRPMVGKIDEEYDEIVTEKGACIEFRFCEGNWFILSSDGLKFS